MNSVARPHHARGGHRQMDTENTRWGQMRLVSNRKGREVAPSGARRGQVGASPQPRLPGAGLCQNLVESGGTRKVLAAFRNAQPHSYTLCTLRLGRESGLCARK